MDRESDPAATRNRLGAMWQLEPFSKSPRPWLLATLTFACVALVIAGSLGPWLYTERGPARAVEIQTISGFNTDGVFSLFFGSVAAVALLIALLRPDRVVPAWIAFVALVLCSLVGLFDWVIFDPMALMVPSAMQAQVVRVEWGLKLLTIAAPMGAVCAFLLARQLMRGA